MNLTNEGFCTAAYVLTTFNTWEVKFCHIGKFLIGTETMQNSGWVFCGVSYTFWGHCAFLCPYRQETCSEWEAQYATTVPSQNCSRCCHKASAPLKRRDIKTSWSMSRLVNIIDNAAQHFSSSMQTIICVLLKDELLLTPAARRRHKH